MISPEPDLILPAPPPWLRVHALLLITACLTLLANSVLVLTHPRTPGQFLGGTCSVPYLAALAWLQYSAVFRCRPAQAVAAAILCFGVSLLMLYATLMFLFLSPGFTALLLTAAPATYAAAAGVINLRWSQRAAPRPWWICRSCGYDLRATPGRCPECGTIV